MSDSGTYYLLIDGESPAAVNYQFRLSDTSTVPLSFGSVVSGTLSPSSATDVYSFSGTAGQRVYFENLDESNGYDGYYWTLYGPDNQAITGNWAGEDLAATLSIDGVYTLILTNNAAYGGDSSYSFEAFQNTTSSALYNVGDVASGTLANPGDQAAFAFSGTAGQRLFFSALGTDSSIDFDLYGPDGISVTSGSLRPIAGPFTLIQSGNYTIKVFSSGRNSGDFNFQLLDLATAPTLSLNTEIDGTLDTVESANLYQFSGKAGQRIDFAALSDSNGNYGASWALYGPWDQNIASAYYFSDFRVTLPADGIYTLIISSSSNYDSGSTYSIEAYQATIANAVYNVGDVASGTIANPGDQATYTFAGSAGQRLFFNGLSGGGSIDFYLNDPDGGFVTYGYLGSNSGPFTLMRAGTYTATIYGAGRGTGHFAFQLFDLASAPSVGFGGSVSGTLVSNASANLYQFNGTAGQRIDFENQSESNGYYGYYWTLYGPNNQTVTGNWAGGDLAATLPVDGVYTLILAGYTGYSSGSTYSFEAFENTTSNAVYNVGDLVSGTLANPGDQASYVFSGSVGQRLFWNGLGADSSMNMTLYGPDGQSVTFGYLSSNSGPFILTQAGTYTLTVSGAGGGKGHFAFQLFDLASASSLGFGTSASGTLTNNDSAKLYQFSGTAGQRVYFENQTESNGYYGYYWTLYDPNNQTVTGNWAGGDLAATLPVDGEYTLILAGYTGYSNGSTYSFEAFENTTSNAIYNVGDLVSGALANPGDQATYFFTGAAGQRLLERARLRQLHGPDSLRPRWPLRHLRYPGLEHRAIHARSGGNVHVDGFRFQPQHGPFRLSALRSGQRCGTRFRRLG